MNFRYPNITGKTEKEQIEQIRRYLFQLVDQLNYTVPKLTENSDAAANTKNASQKQSKT
jgi:hypothetical protein